MKKWFYRNASILFLISCFIIGLVIMYFSHVYLTKQDSNAIDSILIVLAPFICGIGMVYFGIWGENKLEKQKRVRTQGRCGEIIVDIDEISSCHIEGGFSHTDYILILKNGTRYNLNAESYNKVMNLISE